MSDTHVAAHGRQRCSVHSSMAAQSESPAHLGTQRPAPLQTSDVRQPFDGWGLLPTGTNVQTPIAPGSAHDLQTSPQAVAQQTPCAQ